MVSELRFVSGTRKKGSVLTFRVRQVTLTFRPRFRGSWTSNTPSFCGDLRLDPRVGERPLWEGWFHPSRSWAPVTVVLVRDEDTDVGRIIDLRLTCGVSCLPRLRGDTKSCRGTGVSWSPSEARGGCRFLVTGPTLDSVDVHLRAWVR